MKRLMRLALAGVLGALLAMAFGTPALALLARTAVEIKANPTVSGPMITFGDLFDNAGDAANVPVIAAPRPGQKISIDARSLASLASDHGLVWAISPGSQASKSHAKPARSARRTLPMRSRRRSASNRTAAISMCGSCNLALRLTRLPTIRRHRK